MHCMLSVHSQSLKRASLKAVGRFACPPGKYSRTLKIYCTVSWQASSGHRTVNIQYRLRSFLLPSTARPSTPARQAKGFSGLHTSHSCSFSIWHSRLLVFSLILSISTPSFLSSSIRIRLKLHHLLPFFLLPSSPLRLLFCAPSFISISLLFPSSLFPASLRLHRNSPKQASRFRVARQSQLRSHSICPHAFARALAH